MQRHDDQGFANCGPSTTEGVVTLRRRDREVIEVTVCALGD